MTNQLQADQQRHIKHEKREKFNTCGIQRGQNFPVISV